MSKSFDKLKREIKDEYEKKGYSKKKADYIAKATAGEIARRKNKKHKKDRWL